MKNKRLLIIFLISLSIFVVLFVSAYNVARNSCPLNDKNCKKTEHKQMYMFVKRYNIEYYVGGGVGIMRESFDRGHFFTSDKIVDGGVEMIIPSHVIEPNGVSHFVNQEEVIPFEYLDRVGYTDESIKNASLLMRIIYFINNHIYKF